MRFLPTIELSISLGGLSLTFNPPEPEPEGEAVRIGFTSTEIDP